MSTVTGSRGEAAAALRDPTPASGAETERCDLAALLDRPRYEVLPVPATVDVVEAHVPPIIPVTVTASPRRGLEPTLQVTEDLVSRGYSAVPHLAARMVHDDQHLADLLVRLDEAAIRDVFVVAGDGDAPVGDFSGSLELLRSIERLDRSGLRRRPTRVGVPGYPEGHPHVAADELDRVLLAKQPLSSYVVTQMCFDAGAVLTWIAHIRALGVRLPVQVGVAGAVDQLKLLRVAGRIGVGTSLRFLRKHQGVARLLRPGAYRPDRLVEGLACDVVPGESAVAGLHVYTLGDVAGTERWRREMLDQLTHGRGHG